MDDLESLDHAGLLRNSQRQQLTIRFPDKVPKPPQFSEGEPVKLPNGTPGTVKYQDAWGVRLNEFDGVFCPYKLKRP